MRVGKGRSAADGSRLILTVIAADKSASITGPHRIHLAFRGLDDERPESAEGAKRSVSCYRSDGCWSDSGAAGDMTGTSHTSSHGPRGPVTRPCMRPAHHCCQSVKS